MLKKPLITGCIGATVGIFAVYLFYRRFLSGEIIEFKSMIRNLVTNYRLILNLIFFEIINKFLLLAMLMSILVFIVISFFKVTTSTKGFGDIFQSVSNILIGYIGLNFADMSYHNKYNVEVSFKKSDDQNTLIVKNSGESNLYLKEIKLKTIANEDNKYYKENKEKVLHGATEKEIKNTVWVASYKNNELCNCINRTLPIKKFFPKDFETNFDIGYYALTDINTINGIGSTSIAICDTDIYNFTLEIFFEDKRKFIHKSIIKGRGQIVKRDFSITEVFYEDTNLDILKTLNDAVKRKEE